MEIKDFILIILVFFVLYLMYKTRNLEKLNSTAEHFETSIDVAINNKYTADMDAIRNLASLANNILSSKDSFKIPASKIYMNDVIISGSINMENKDTLLSNIFPKYMVIAWASNEIPLGWAPCDGNKYILNDVGKYLLDPILGDITPDLRGKFILGSGFGGKDMNNILLTERKVGQTGGEEKHLLIESEIATHNHKIDWFEISCRGSGCLADSSKDRKIYEFDANGTPRLNDYGNGYMIDLGGLQASASHDLYSDYGNPKGLPQYTVNGGGKLKPNTGNKKDGAADNYPVRATWETTPHNNMPPYFVLTYIMKL